MASTSSSGESHAVGSLCSELPDFVRQPPVETVAFGWGVSEDGQLGVDTEEDVKLPKVIEALLGTRFCGRAFVTIPLIGGSRSTLALDAEGQILSWGWNARATLGLGHMHEKVRKPKRIQTLQGVRIVQVAIGGWHCLAVDARGQAWAWGGNEYGQCALPTDQKDVLVPTKCAPELKITQVAAGGMHSCALTESGDVWTWGEPWGDFSMKVNRQPRKVPHAENVAKIACGAFHNLALTKDGRVLTWGINDFGQLGNGSTVYEIHPTSVQGLEAVTVADIAAGGWHSLALTSEGEVYVWGRGEYGRLGLGDNSASSKLRPCKVPGLEGHRVVQASCGGTHTMVLTDEGRMFAWGRCSFGRLGKNVDKDCSSPEEIYLPGGPERWRVISVCCGGRHSLALALPDNEPASLQSLQSSRKNSVFPAHFEDLPTGEPLLGRLRPKSAFRAHNDTIPLQDETGAELAQEGRAQQEDSGQSTPHDLISVMERQEAEEEAEAVALNGGVEPGTVVDYMREEEASTGISPGGDSPGLETGSSRPETMQQQLHQVLSLQGLRDGLPD